MQTVVLGATGFLGGAVCAELLSQGIETIAVGRGHLRPGIATRLISVSDYRSLPSELKGAVCIHLATPGHLGNGTATERENLIAANVATTASLAEFGFSKIVFASSAAVYGDSLGRPATENDPCIANGDYTKLKIECEKTLNLDRHAVARIANVYGPGMSELNVLSDILKQLRSADGNLKKIVVRDLSPLRDYVAVKDVARALVKMAVGPFTGVLNIGSGRPRSVRDVANLLLDAFGLSHVELIASAPSLRPSYLVLDSSKAASALPWQAESNIQTEFTSLKNEFLKKDKT